MTRYLTIVHEVDDDTDILQLTGQKTVSAMSWSHALNDRDKHEAHANRLAEENHELMVQLAEIAYREGRYVTVEDAIKELKRTGGTK